MRWSVLIAVETHGRVQQLDLLPAQLDLLRPLIPQAVKKVGRENARNEIHRIALQVDAGQEHIEEGFRSEFDEFFVQNRLDGSPKVETLLRVVAEVAERRHDSLDRWRIQIVSCSDEAFGQSVQYLRDVDPELEAVVGHCGEQLLIDRFGFQETLDGLDNERIKEVHLMEKGEDPLHGFWSDAMKVDAQPVGDLKADSPTVNRDGSGDGKNLQDTVHRQLVNVICKYKTNKIIEIDSFYSIVKKPTQKDPFDVVENGLLALFQVWKNVEDFNNVGARQMASNESDPTVVGPVLLLDVSEELDGVANLTHAASVIQNPAQAVFR